MSSENTKISLSQLKLYLQFSNWKNVDTNYEGLEAYVNPEDERIYTVLPREELNNEYASNYIEKTIEIISTIRDQSKEETASYIDDLDSDHHSFCLQTKKNKISLLLLEGIISSTKETLYKNSVIEYKSWYEKLSEIKQKESDAPTVAAKKLINSLNFPHTYSGSFGISIDVPLHYESFSLFPNMNDETIERRATILTATGLKVFSESAKKKTESYAIDQIQDRKIINSFKPFISLIEGIEKRIFSYNLNLSPIIKGKRYDKYNNLKAELDQNTLVYINKAIEQVGEDEEAKRILFFGFPTNMKSDRESLLDESGQGTRKVTVKGESKITGSRSLVFELSIDDYKKALHAHESALSIVIDCIVQKDNRTYDVIEVNDLRIIDKLPNF